MTYTKRGVKGRWTAKLGYNTYEESKAGFPIKKINQQKGKK